MKLLKKKSKYTDTRSKFIKGTSAPDTGNFSINPPEILTPFYSKDQDNLWSNFMGISAQKH